MEKTSGKLTFAAGPPGPQMDVLVMSTSTSSAPKLRTDAHRKLESDADGSGPLGPVPPSATYPSGLPASGVTTIVKGDAREGAVYVKYVHACARRGAHGSWWGRGARGGWVGLQGVRHHTSPEAHPSP